MSLHPLDDSIPTDCERLKLYNKALFPQVAINSLIGDISTLLEEEHMMSSSVCKRGMHQLN